MTFPVPNVTHLTWTTALHDDPLYHITSKPDNEYGMLETNSVKSPTKRTNIIKSIFMELVTTRYIFVGIYCTELRASCKKNSRIYGKNFIIYFFILFYFFNYNQQDATIFDYLSLNGSTCFGQFLCPSSGVYNCTFSFRYCQPILLQAGIVDEAELRGT